MLVTRSTGLLGVVSVTNKTPSFNNRPEQSAPSVHSDVNRWRGHRAEPLPLTPSRAGPSKDPPDNLQDAGGRHPAPLNPASSRTRLEVRGGGASPASRTVLPALSWEPGRWLTQPRPPLELPSRLKGL